jgi:hypothetical protein
VGLISITTTDLRIRAAYVFLNRRKIMIDRLENNSRIKDIVKYSVRAVFFGRTLGSNGRTSQDHKSFGFHALESDQVVDQKNEE